MPALALGPILRHVGENAATIWVETDAPCEVEVLGARERTLAVGGRHYAILVVAGLEPGVRREYDVALDGRPAWPPPGGGFPPSSIRPPAPDRRPRIAFGSCRASAPHEPPFTLRRASDRRGRGVDALRAFALRMASQDRDAWPDLLLMLGDQIYADDPSPAVLERLASRPATAGEPAGQLRDFDDYAFAYCDAWRDPAIRWLLSTVPTAMVFDDHEIHDEWKISQAWVDRMRSREWYDRRIAGGLAAYWLYQHVGNLTPDELAASDLLRRCREAEDALPLLTEFAHDADRQSDHSRWSFARDVGRTRLVVIDSRAGRQLEPGRRAIVDEGEWAWIRDRVAADDYDHLLLASSVPFLLTRGLHDFEAWNEALCDGVWGRAGASAGEWVRQRANLGHWAAFQRSFARLAQLLEDLAAGRLRAPPAGIGLLSGDVHHCYVAEAAFPHAPGASTPVWQAVCSGLRKQLDPGEALAMRAAQSRAGTAVGRALAASVRAPRPPIDWRLTAGPLYANQIATLDLRDGDATVRVETTRDSPREGEPRLRTAFEWSVPAAGALRRRAGEPG